MPDIILVVDDEENVLRSLRDYLARHDFEVVTALDGESALDVLATVKPALVVLDVQMAGVNGFDVCSEIRRAPGYIPIIMISGVRRETVDRVVGLEVGADKYLLKPFDLPVLLAEIRSLLHATRASGADQPPDGWISLDSFLSINRQLRQVRAGGQSPHLSVLEFDLLVYLIDRAGTPCSRDDLIEFVWNDTTGCVSDLAVNSCIARLRKKIEPDPANPVYIQSMYGWGYKFCALD